MQCSAMASRACCRQVCCLRALIAFIAASFVQMSMSSKCGCQQYLVSMFAGRWMVISDLGHGLLWLQGVRAREGRQNAECVSHQGFLGGRRPPLIRASSAKLRHWLALLKSVTPMCVASPRSSCTTRSTKNMSPGNCLTPIFFKGESGSNGSTLKAAHRGLPQGGDITPACCHVAAARDKHRSGCRHAF